MIKRLYSQIETRKRIILKAHEDIDLFYDKIKSIEARKKEDIKEKFTIPSTFPTVISIVSKLTGITKDEILSSSRKKEIMEAKMILCYILSRRFGIRHKQISSVLSVGRSAVGMQISRFESQASKNHILRSNYNAILDRIECNLLKKYN